jgi:hypothetical protein
MLSLIKELVKREWDFTMSHEQMGFEDDYHLEVTLGSQTRCIYNEDEARELLKEIRKHW